MAEKGGFPSHRQHHTSRPAVLSRRRPNIITICLAIAFLLYCYFILFASPSSTNPSNSPPTPQSDADTEDVSNPIDARPKPLPKPVAFENALGGAPVRLYPPAVKRPSSSSGSVKPSVSAGPPKLPVIDTSSKSISSAAASKDADSKVKMNDTTKVIPHVAANTNKTANAADGAAKSGPLILYWSRHHGTQADFTYVSEQLKLDAVILPPGYWYSNFPPCAFNDEGCGKLIEAICAAYDYIVVGDVTPDAKIFLQKRCLGEDKRAKLVLQITNRFDFDMEKDDEWAEFLAGMMRKYPKKIFIVANNPYEMLHLCHKKITPKRWALIRPVGVSPVDLKPEYGEHVKAGDKSTMGVVPKQGMPDKFLYPELKKLGVQMKVLEEEYGGPGTLATYKAALHWPYQVSIMAMPENLAHGVPYLIPSTEFFTSVCLNHSISYSFAQPDLCVRSTSNSTQESPLVEWAEWWHPDFAPYMTYFDSWQDLKVKLDTVDFVEKGRKALEFMKGFREKSLAEWRKVFGLEGLDWEDAFEVKRNVCVEEDDEEDVEEFGELKGRKKGH